MYKTNDGMTLLLKCIFIRSDECKGTAYERTIRSGQTDRCEMHAWPNSRQKYTFRLRQMLEVPLSFNLIKGWLKFKVTNYFFTEK